MSAIIRKNGADLYASVPVTAVAKGLLFSSCPFEGFKRVSSSVAQTFTLDTEVN